MVVVLWLLLLRGGRRVDAPEDFSVDDIRGCVRHPTPQKAKTPQKAYVLRLLIIPTRRLAAVTVIQIVVLGGRGRGLGVGGRERHLWWMWVWGGGERSM